MEFLLINNFLLVGMAAFFAGMLNALAGGGTFLTLPSLIFIGVPPVVANATSAAALLPGYLGAALGYRAILKEINKIYLLKLLVLVMSASILGALLLVKTPNSVFLNLTPWLILVATALFILSPYITNQSDSGSYKKKSLQPLGVFLVGGYGGYFNGGLGIALLSVLSLNTSINLNQMIALKSVMSSVLTLVSVMFFAISGIIQWPLALSMMLFSMLGGYLGAKLTQKLSKELTRKIIISIGILMTIFMFYTSLAI